MPDLLIRKVDPDLKRRIEQSAREHNRSLSAEAQELLRKGLAVVPDQRKLGTELFDLVPPEYRSDEYVFEYPGEISAPDLE
jgi:plasmid stability protein